MILKFKTCAITTMLSKFTYDTMVNLFATQCWGECAKEIHRSIPLGSIENDYLTFDRSYLKKKIDTIWKHISLLRNTSVR